jgi:Replication-relaxation
MTAAPIYAVRLESNQEAEAPAVALPLDAPTAHQSSAPFRQASGTSSRSASRKTASDSGRSPSRGRLGRHQLDRLVVDLSDRDKAVLQTLADYRFLTTRQLQRWHFSDHASAESGERTTRRVLARLQATGLLRQMDRRVGGLGAGSSQPVWRLSDSSHRLLAIGGADGVKPRRRTFHEPSLRLLDHTVAVAEAALQLVDLGRSTSAIESVAIQTEPASWRRYQGAEGVQLIRPDLAVSVNGVDDEGANYEDRWFIEVDQGGMHAPTFIERCLQYERYRLSGQEQAAHDVFPLVVWVLHQPERVDRLQDELERSARLDARRFRLTTMGDLANVVAGGAL